MVRDRKCLALLTFLSSWSQILELIRVHLDFLGGSAVKNPPAMLGDTGDTSLIPGSGRCPGEGHGDLLQYSCWENPMDGGAWPWCHKESGLTEATKHNTARDSPIRGWDGWMAWPTQWTCLSKLWEIVKDKEGWHAAVHGITKSQTGVIDWTIKDSLCLVVCIDLYLFLT